MSHLYFNEESDYSKENACENEVFRSNILHHRKKLNIFTSRLSRRCITHSIEISIGANARRTHWRCSLKKGVLKNFTTFTGKHLCESLFFNKVTGLRQLFSTEQLQTTASEMRTFQK